MDLHAIMTTLAIAMPKPYGNPNRSNARYSLSKPISIKSLEKSFTILDWIDEAEASGKKVNNYELAKVVGIEVEQRNTEEE